MDRELKQKIEAVLDEKVRPYLSGHGGGIEVDSLEGGTLRVYLEWHGQTLAVTVETGGT